MDHTGTSSDEEAHHDDDFLHDPLLSHLNHRHTHTHNDHHSSETTHIQQAQSTQRPDKKREGSPPNRFRSLRQLESAQTHNMATARKERGDYSDLTSSTGGVTGTATGYTVRFRGVKIYILSVTSLSLSLLSISL